MKNMYKSNSEFRTLVNGFLYISIGIASFAMFFAFSDFIATWSPTFGPYIAAIPGVFIYYTLGKAITDKIKSLKKSS